MGIVVLSLIALSVVPSLLMARAIIKKRKRLIYADESKRRLQASLQNSLAIEEKNRRDLEEKLSKVQKGYKRLEEALQLKTEEAKEWHRILKEEQIQRLVEKEAREKAEKKKLEILDAERSQLEKRLSQAAEETQHLVDKLRMAERERDRLEVEQRKLMEREQHQQAERETWDRMKKEVTEKFESQI